MITCNCMKINVAVFFGGRSVEHEISVISASQAMAAFDRNKYNVIPIYISKQGRWYTGEALFDLDKYRNIEILLKQCTEVFFIPEFGNEHYLYKKKTGLFGSKFISKVDIVFPVLHGTNGEDGTFQGLIELIGLPYVGCNILASVNGMDKITMKMIIQSSGLPVVDYVWFTDKQWHQNRNRQISDIEEKLFYPLIVKPANLGSSVGISKAKNREELIRAIDFAESFSTRILVEKMIVNIREINCAVLGSPDKNRTSVCEEPLKSGEILSYEDKYMGGGKASGSKGMQSLQRRVPAHISEEMSDRIRGLASETFRVLSCDGVARVDFITDTVSNEIFVNEINTIPGSLSFYLWDASNLNFSELIDELIDISIKRSRDKELKTVSYEQNIFSLQGTKLGGTKN